MLHQRFAGSPKGDMLTFTIPTMSGEQMIDLDFCLIERLKMIDICMGDLVEHVATLSDNPNSEYMQGFLDSTRGFREAIAEAIKEAEEFIND